MTIFSGEENTSPLWGKKLQFVLDSKVREAFVPPTNRYYNIEHWCSNLF
jgi:hypothetical protein